MPPLSLTEQAQQLHSLAREFETLHARVRGVSYTPGTDALRQIGPLLLRTQDLTATVLVRLGALDNSAYADIAGSHAGLERLSSVVVYSSTAGNDLASALFANSYNGAPLHGDPPDTESVRNARRAEAIARMSGHLADAARQLGVSGIGCHHVASGITDDLATAHRQTKPVRQVADPVLSPAQYSALNAFNLGPGERYESSQRGFGAIRVSTTDGTRVTVATLEVLYRRELVELDTSTSLFHGQRISVTKLGRQALAKSRLAATTAAPARAIPKPPVARGARR